MSLFVFVSDQCRDDAATHALKDVIDRVEKQVEESQSLSTFDNFPPPYYVKKKLKGRQPRLVAELRSIGEHEVLIFLRVLIRSDHEYDAFHKDPNNYGRQYFSRLASSDALERFITRRTTAPNLPGRPQPSNAEMNLLYSTLTHVGANSDGGGYQLDIIVCESQEWVRQVGAPPFRQQLNRISDSCLRALEMNEGTTSFPVKDKAPWRIWAHRQGQHRLLLGIDDGTNSTASEQRAREIVARLSPNDPDSVLRESRRAYPSIVLADDELWMNLEAETEANMALSPEETQVLVSAREIEAPFPLFINGRAGSGKSTILQYLFAELMFAYGTKCWTGSDANAGTAQEEVGIPLYLTANGELLRNARAFVDRLLASEARFSITGDEIDGAQRRSLLERAFREFHPFMLELLPPDGRAKFNARLRIDYPAFRRLWEERFGKDPQMRRDCSPDVSWHVIRTYIKGLSSDGLLDPEDYDQLPVDQMSVSKEDFDRIFQRVWKGWYDPLRETGAWDDQDLARYILDEDLAPRRFSAVFCDEAQDFTRIELEVLLRLSLYSNRALPPGSVGRVPFAFAGDEFQTLNPTGFRWGAIKAAFVEKFVFELAPERRRGPAELNYQELRFNYRSTPPIVRFCNLLQLMRAARFDIRDLRPQRAWAMDDGAPPVMLFRSEDRGFWEAYREAAAAFVLILPCLEGEEAEFVRADPLLRQYVKFEGDVPVNVLSSGRAKGCEYPAVMVYGFGDKIPEHLVNTIASEPEDEQDHRASLAMQYFINRLYVAISRAKRRLVIVDSEAGIARLWVPALQEPDRERIVARLHQDPDVWSTAIGGIAIGRPQDLTAEAVPDRSEHGRLFEAEGMTKRDAYLMFQASSAYRDAGLPDRANICRAWALNFEGRALEAGPAFAQAGLIDEARQVLWRAERKGWQVLLKLAADYPDLGSHLEVRWIAVLERGPAELDRARELLEALAKRLEDAELGLKSYGDTAWSLALDRLLELIFPSRGPSAPNVVAKGILQLVDQIATYEINIADRLRAEIAFAAGFYELAVSAWEKSGEKRPSRYIEAKARSAPYPTCIEFLHQTGDMGAIRSAFDEHRDLPLNEKEASIVAEALSAAQRFDDALTCLGRSPQSGALFKLAYLAFPHKVELAVGVLRRAVAAAALQGDWAPLVTLTKDPASLLRSGEAVTASVSATTVQLAGLAEELQVIMVRALARSDAFADTTEFLSKDALRKFLMDALRVTNAGQWTARISFREAGAAIERSGRFNEALSYYEAALTYRQLPKSEQRAMQERWLAVKQRKLENSERRGQREAPSRTRSDLEAKARRWGLPVGPWPRFPQLGPMEPEHRESPTASLQQAVKNALKQPPAFVEILDDPVSPPAPNGSDAQTPATEITPVGNAEFRLGNLRVELSRESNRCLVTHMPTMDVAKIQWAPLRVTSTLDVVEKGAASHEVPEWGLVVRQEATAAGPRLLLNVASLGVDLMVTT